MAAASMDGDFLGDDISSKGKHYPMVVLTNKKLLLDDQFADITIYVNSDKVSAHSAILACRCEELVPMPNESDKKKKVKPKKDVKVKGIANEQIMRRVLEFLYTGRVEFPKLPTLEILQLNAAARHFKLNRLGYLCERWLREHMCMDNVFHLLKGSVDAGETRVKAFCLQYALDHYTEFIANKDGIHILGIDLFQEVVKAFTDRPPAPEEIPPDKAPPDTLIEDFQRLYDRMPYSDVVFNVGGTQIKCHKAILAAHSDSFVPHIANAPATGVDFNALSPAAFQSMLKFLYYGDDNIDPHPATELVGFSKQYKLHSLLGICEDKCRTSVSTETVLDILATTYIPEMEEKPELVEELKRKTFPFILANLTDIDLSPIRKLHPNIAIDILLQIQKSWGESIPAYDGGGDYSSTSTSTSTSSSFTSTSTSTSTSGGSGGGGSFALGSQRAAAPPPPIRGSTGGDDERPPPPPPRSAPPSVGAPPTPGFPPPVTTSSSTDDARPPPPPPRDASANGLQAPPPLSSSGGGPTPPPRIGDPPPPIGIPAGTAPPPPIGDGSETPKKGGGDKTPKKTSSSGGIKKDGAKKKEDEKKKKEEEKRIAKEKKEREKMEKKVKGGSKAATKAPPS